MFIELESERSSKLRTSAIFSFPKAHCLPPELVTFTCSASYKHLPRCGRDKYSFGFQQHTITPLSMSHKRSTTINDRSRLFA